jgi:hypothetical protein
MYEFEHRKELIDVLREKLDASMATEANECFASAINNCIKSVPYPLPPST